jgi:hypothetical protein
MERWEVDAMSDGIKAQRDRPGDRLEAVVLAHGGLRATPEKP